MFVGYPLAHRGTGGLMTFGFVLGEIGMSDRGVHSAAYVEMVSVAMLRACRGDKFAQFVAETAIGMVQAVQAKGGLGYNDVPWPFVYLDPVTSNETERVKAIDSIAMMIADLGVLNEPHVSLAASGQVGASAPTPISIKERAAA